MIDIIERFREAQQYDSCGYDCIGAAFFLVGIDKSERYRKPGFILEYDSRLTNVSSIDDALLIGLDMNHSPGHIKHLATLFPGDQTKIIQRAGPNKPIR